MNRAWKNSDGNCEDGESLVWLGFALLLTALMWRRVGDCVGFIIVN